MSKQAEWSMLVPGPLGWEIWKRQADGAFERSGSEDGPQILGELTGLPGGDLAMLFPVRAFHALPFRAASTDDELFEDLATMHAERLGVRADPMAGQLSDTFEVWKEEDSTVLLHAVLRKPAEGELPLRTPKEFDLSPRAYDVQGNALCVWKELGRWVFACYSSGKLLYCQGTASTTAAPDRDVLQEIRLAVGQLGMQGLKFEPSSIHIWPPEGELGEAGELADAFRVTPQVSRRPDPRLPEHLSSLLPADVRAARAQRAQRNQRAALAAMAALAYLGVVGWLGYGHWQEARKLKKLSKEVAEAESGGAAVVGEHNARWEELGAVVDAKLNPLQIMNSIHAAIPKNTGLRLKTADLNVAAGEIQIIGNAPASAPVTTFYAALKRNPNLSWLEWDEEPPASGKQGWDFRIKGAPPKAIEE